MKNQQKTLLHCSVDSATRILLFSLPFFFSGCQDPAPSSGLSMDFSTSPTANRIQPDNTLLEASGLVHSIKQPGFLWTHEDAGEGNYLFLITDKGQIAGKYRLNVPNYDWEDLAIGPGPVANETYLYLADIGANDNARDIRTIYRLPEPASLQTPVPATDAIRFRFPDGGYDAETILLDPLTKDIYIVTKFLANAHLYRLAYPQAIDKVTTAEKVGEMTIGGDLTGGATSTDGKELIVRAYIGIYYWQRKDGETFVQTLLRKYDKSLPYVIEPQGEAVCFEKAGKGYFTLSEIGKASSVNLYYYERK
jgi:hypothetical protein